MKANLLLISPPWSNPSYTSIQTGSLHTYVQQRFAERVRVQSFAAHLTIGFHVFGAAAGQAFTDLHLFGEYLSLLAYRRRFCGAKAKEEAAAIRAMNAHFKKRGSKTMLPTGFAKRLAEALDDYIDQRVGPNVDPDAINIVGLTTNFDQVYASLYFTRRLAQLFPEARFLFVLGGASVSLGHVIPVLRKHPQELLLVVGEGEGKLEKLLEHCLAAPEDVRMTTLRTQIAHDVAGCLCNEDPRVADLVRDNPYLRDQVELPKLGIPDYAAYFDELRAVSENQRTFDALKSLSEVTLEGSRGCFAKCDFCGLNSTWTGFRTNKAENVAAAVEHLGAAHGVRTIRFVDNVCDTWAEAFADIMLERGNQYDFFMELRASHPETFWAKLSLAGATEIQVGVEALSDPLLDHIQKKTTVMHNLAATKYLAELGIESSSNLMLGHPKSTYADIEETVRLIELTPHFPPYALTYFSMVPGSPLYREWLETSTEPFNPRFEPIRALPPAFKRDVIGWLRSPENICTPEVMSGWKRFAKWFAAFMADAKGAKLDVRRLDARTLLVEDRRKPSAFHRLVDDDALVYSECHRPTNLSKLCAKVKLSRDDVAARLEHFLAERLMVRVGDEYLSLALRPRDELLTNVIRKATAQRPAAEKRRLTLLAKSA